MHKIIHKIMYILLLTAGVAQAEVRLYNDALGLPAGSSYQVANTTFYQDALNLPFATANRIGNTDVYSNSLNLPMGGSVNAGPNPLGNNQPLPWETKRNEPF